MDTILMHGPSFDGSGKIVERQVPKDDITAYINAGYAMGGLEIVYTEADAIAQNDGEDVTKPKKAKGKK